LKKPSLLVLAAGLSSRYKLGLKQLDTFGPSGETLLDYAIFDAIMAGFGKVIFVIQKEVKDNFEKRVTAKYSNKIDCDFVFQELDDLPTGYKVPSARKKPWGTGHAVWVAREKINEPFAVINADDFYGRESYKIMAAFLKKNTVENEGKYSMIGFNLQNTLSDYGSVARGLCKVNDGYLLDIDEQTNIQKKNGAPISIDENGAITKLNPSAVVSMNFWGFTADLFPRIEYAFRIFLNQNLDNEKAEIYLPFCIKEQLKMQNISVEVLHSSSKWIGVTYPDDKIFVKNKLKSFRERGVYPTSLF